MRMSHRGWLASGHYDCDLWSFGGRSDLRILMFYTRCLYIWKSIEKLSLGINL